MYSIKSASKIAYWLGIIPLASLTHTGKDVCPFNFLLAKIFNDLPALACFAKFIDVITSVYKLSTTTPALGCAGILSSPLIGILNPLASSTLNISFASDVIEVCIEKIIIGNEFTFVIGINRPPD